jgi:Protein of unknown function (DUF3311)
VRPIYWLAVIPYIGILLGPMVHNEMYPLILGMPFPLGWITIWVPITAILMWIVYTLDPATKEGDDQ